MAGRQFRFDIRQASKQIVIVLALLFGVNALFYFLAVRPTVREYRSLSESKKLEFEQLEERRDEVRQREEFLTSLQQAVTDLETLRLDILSTREKRMVAVHAELERLAGKFKIDLDSVDFDNEMLLDEELDRHTMNVPLEGGYAALRRFLQAVEDSQEFLVVERVALAKGKQGGVMLQLNIALATYFNAPPELVEKKRRMERQRGRRRA